MCVAKIECITSDMFYGRGLTACCKFQTAETMNQIVLEKRWMTNYEKRMKLLITISKV